MPFEKMALYRKYLLFENEILDELKESVTEALKSTEFIELEIGYKVRINFQYSQEKQINYILNNSKVLNKEFLENVVYTVLINDKVLEKLNNYDLEILEKLYIEKV